MSRVRVALSRFHARSALFGIGLVSLGTVLSSISMSQEQEDVKPRISLHIVNGDQSECLSHVQKVNWLAGPH